MHITIGRTSYMHCISTDSMSYGYLSLAVALDIVGEQILAVSTHWTWRKSVGKEGL